MKLLKSSVEPIQPRYQMLRSNECDFKFMDTDTLLQPIFWVTFKTFSNCW